MVSVLGAVTVNIVESELDPSSVAETIRASGVELGTVKLAEKSPLVSVVTVAGIVVTGLPAKVMITLEIGSKLMHVTITKVLTSPDVGLSVMSGVTVNGFEASLDPWIALTV